MNISALSMKFFKNIVGAAIIAITLFAVYCANPSSSDDETMSITGSDNEREIPADVVDEVVVTAPKAESVSIIVAPNPVARGSSVTLHASAELKGNLSVYDAIGTRVATIAFNGTEATWNLTDSRGRYVPTGTYLVKGTLRSASGQSTDVSTLVGVVR